MKIETLTWDSEFFGFPVGKLLLQANDDWNEARTLLEHSDRILVYIQTDNRNTSLIAQISTHAPLYDRKTCFRKQLQGTPRWPDTITEYQGPLLPELLQLALTSGEFSRFRQDPRLQTRFEQLYTIWIEKSLAKQMADAVLVSKDNAQITGFATVSAKDSTGQIGLIAVSPDCRGKGIASQLLQAADAWYTLHHCQDAAVITQRDNSPACNLYHKNGYAISECTAICHWWK